MLKFLHEKQIASFNYENKVRPLNLNLESIEKGLIYELGLEVDVDILNHQSYDALEWVINFKNTGGSKTHNLSKILGLDSTVPFVESDEVFFESLNGDQCDSESFMPIKRKIAIGEEMIVAPKGGRSSDFAFPFFDINTKEKGLILAIGWTGQWNLRLARDKDGLKVEVGFANDDFYLNPGESARSMRILVMGWEGDYLDAHNKFRRFMIEKNSPKAKLGGELSLPAAIQTFDLYSYVEKHAEIANFYNSEAGQLEILKRSLKCGGIDAFWVDASWFINHFPYGVGNYTFKEGFPNGLRPVFDEAHKQGMKTVMWFEPERVAQDTEMCRLHPEWLIEVAPEQGGLWGNNNNQQRLFNLAIPEAREFLTEFISNFIVEQGVDIYRQDFNMEIKNFWDANDEVGRSGLTEIKYIEGFYRFWDDLNARFPHLLIDNCSSGGRRIDLETCKRSVNLWRSDTGCYPMSDEMNTDIWNQNQVLGISKYTPYHSTAVWSLNTYEFRSAMTAGIALTFDLFSEDFNYSKASKLMEEFQNQKKYWEGDFYPLTEASLDETIWAAFQFNLKEEDKGMILIFRRKNNLLSSGNYRLRGLNPDKMYEVRIKDDDLNVVNKRASGKELMSGFEFGILSQRASLFVEYF